MPQAAASARQRFRGPRGLHPAALRAAALGVQLESVGLYGASQVRRVDLPSGRVLAATPRAAARFGEGLGAHGQRHAAGHGQAMADDLRDSAAAVLIGEVDGASPQCSYADLMNASTSWWSLSSDFWLM